MPRTENNPETVINKNPQDVIRGGNSKGSPERNKKENDLSATERPEYKPQHEHSEEIEELRSPHRGLDPEVNTPSKIRPDLDII